MREISQITLVAFGVIVAAGIMLYLFIEYNSESAVAYEPQRIYAEMIQQAYHQNIQFENFVKVTDMTPGSGLHFYYPNSENNENRDAFQFFTLIRLPEYFGGAANDTSAFRAYSALDVTSHCVIKYWPDEQRDNRIEDPCQSAGYRVIDGVSVHPHAKNLRGPSTGALAQLDLQIDEQGYLTVLKPTFTEEQNGVVGVGRTVTDEQILEGSKKFHEIYSARLPAHAIIPFTMNDYSFHYAAPEEFPRFDYYHEFIPQDVLHLKINPENYCSSEHWMPPKHGYLEQSFGINDKTIHYEIRDDEIGHYYVYFDFCLDGLLYSIGTNVQFERAVQIIVDTWFENENWAQNSNNYDS